MSITIGDLVAILRLDKKKFDSDLDKTSSQVKSFGSSVASNLTQSLSFAVGGIIQQGLTSITNGIKQTAGAAFDAVANHELLEMSLESLIAKQFKAADSTISMSDALAAAGPLSQQLLGWVQQLAIASPFDDKDIQSAIQLGSAYKFNITQAKELTQALTDNAAANGRGADSINRAMLALGQINLEGKVTKENLNQLTDAGIDYVSALDKMGMGLDGVTKGSVNADEFIRTLTETLNADVGGAAARATDTWSGLVSSLESMTRTGAIEFFRGLLEPVRPLVAALADAAAADGLRESLRSLGEMAGNFVAPALEWLTGKLEALPAFFDKASGFIQQFRDEMSGMTAGDIMAGLPDTLANLDSQFQKTMSVMEQAHQGTINKLQEQIAQAGTNLGTKLAEINEKFAGKIEDLHERMADTSAQFDERATEAAEDHAKKQADLQKRSVKVQADVEEKLTDLKKDHARRRQELTTNLMLAETEEAYLATKAQIDAENSKYDEQVNKTKAAGSEQLSEIRSQMAEQASEYDKQAAKLQKQRDKAVSDLAEQLAEVQAEKAKETQAARAEYDKQVAALQDKIARENQLYADSVAEQKALFEQQKADAIASAEARAAALGSGPAHDLAEQVKSAIEIWTQFKAKVSEVWDSLQPIFTAFKEVGFWAGMAAIGQWVTDRLNEVSTAVDVWVNDPANKEKFRNWGQQAGQSLIDGIVALLSGEGGWPQIGVALATALGNLKTMIDEATFTMAINFVAGFALAITNPENIQKMADAIGGGLASAADAIGGTLAEISDNIGKFLADSAKSWGEAITSFDWGSVGSNITDGILGGLQASWGELTSWLSSQAASLPDWAANPLGIESPSKAFADKVGAFIPTGILKGFEAGLPDLRSAIAAGAASLVPATAPAGSLAGAMGGNTYISASPTFNLPQAPAGFDRKGLMDEIDQRQLNLLGKLFKRD